MTAEELLKPRFEVIAEYPNSTHRIGTVLAQEITDHFSFTKDGKSFTTSIKNIENYPHIYRKLNWWERRNIEDMPKRLKSLSFPDNEPEEIELWDMENLFGFTNYALRQGCDLWAWKPEFGYVPVD